MPAEFYDHVSRFEVFRYFDGQIVSSREGLAKPDPRMFGLLTERVRSPARTDAFRG